MSEILKKNICGNCHYEWWPRSKKRSPRCPKCSDFYWDIKKKKGDIKDNERDKIK